MSETTARSSDTGSSKQTKDDGGSRKKRKRKKAKVREGVPPFALHYPQDEALDALLVMFEKGNYAGVRERATKLAANAPKETVRQAAEDLLRRLEPDPLARYLLGTASLLLVFFSIWYFTHRLGP